MRLVDHKGKSLGKSDPRSATFLRGRGGGGNQSRRQRTGAILPVVEFRLTYSGRLPANGSVAQKHAIRQQLHPQLRELWRHEPLSEFARSWLTREVVDGDPFTVLRAVGDYDFAPLITADLFLLAELEIVLLKPSTPGALIRQGGDIDNQLKTLFDALRTPHSGDEIPRRAAPGEGETPFFCLLDDDERIVNLSVAVDRYLNPPALATCSSSSS